MIIEHVAIWCRDIDKMKDFYQKYLGFKECDVYRNEDTGLTLNFLSYGEGTTRLELMHKAGIAENPVLPGGEQLGITHLAFSTDTRNELIELHNRLEADGYAIILPARECGNGKWFEDCFLDPEGNRIELSVAPEKMPGY